MQDTTLVISDVEQSVTLVISDVVSLNDYIPKSIINAKGDLIVGGENGEPIRFPTGETNQFLVVDPIENSGYKFTNLFNDLGDIIFGGAGGETVILPGNNTTTKKFLSQTGTGVNSDAVIWDRIAVDDVPILNQNTTGIASAAAILINPRSINGVNFDGSADITINAIDSTPRIALSEKGVANGVATLGVDGLIPTTQLPSYIDDVLEFNNLSMFPVIGEIGKIYVALDTNKVYRWSGSVYIFITSGAVDSVAGKTGVVALNKNDVGLGSVDNTSDLSKPISTATQTALDNKANIFSPVFLGNVTGLGVSTGTSFNSITGLSDLGALAAGVASAGTSTLVARADHIHPAQTSITGNAATATILQTARTINGVSFDGSSNITVTSAASTLTGTTLASNVLASSLTSVGNITTGIWSGLFGAVSGANLTNLTAANISAGIAPISITGNAATVTTNANLTGIITSVGNATSVASQTGTGSTFVMNTSPTLVTPNIGVATALSLATPLINTVSGDLIIDPAGNLVVRGSTSNATTAALNVQNLAGTSLLFARNDGNLVIRTRLHVVGAADPQNISSLGTWAGSLGVSNSNPNYGLDVGVDGHGTVWFQSHRNDGTVEGYNIILQPRIGNVGFGTINPTATVHLKAGTATAGTAPLKFISGTLLTSPEVGVFEYNNTLHFTNSDAVRRNVVVSDQSYTAGAVAVGGRVRMRIGGTEYNVLVE